MECRDAQFYLRLRRHAADELGPDVTAPLEDHLAGCAACAADADAAVSFDRAMGYAMRAVVVPVGLHDRIVRHVASKQGAILRRRAYRVGSLAAAAILVTCIGLSIVSTTRPQLDTAKLANDEDERLNNPEGYTRQWLAQLNNREGYARQWLATQKLPDQLPEEFDYTLLASCDVVNVQGRDVPVVTFRSPEGSGFAKIYIIREGGGFDRKGIQDAQASHVCARVKEYPGPFRGVTYVILHTGGPDGLNQFLHTRNGRGIGA